MREDAVSAIIIVSICQADSWLPKPLEPEDGNSRIWSFNLPSRFLASQTTPQPRYPGYVRCFNLPSRFLASQTTQAATLPLFSQKFQSAKQIPGFPNHGMHRIEPHVAVVSICQADSWLPKPLR